MFCDSVSCVKLAIRLEIAPSCGNDSCMKNTSSSSFVTNVGLNTMLIITSLRHVQLANRLPIGEYVAYKRHLLIHDSRTFCNFV